LKVLVVGDSQAATLAQGLEADPGRAGLSAQPGLAVWNRAILGCSIITVDTFWIDGDRAENGCGGNGAWQQQWAGDVAAFDPDAVVVQAGAWDLFDVANADGSVTRPGSPGWDESYTRDVETLIDTLSAKGAVVVAIRPPCYGNSGVVGAGATPAVRLDRARIDAVDAVWATATAARGADLLDLDPVLCPGGESDATVRPDGAHYGTDGANRVAPRVADEIRSVYAEQALAAGS
jgi:lysophospholipase L1-like esterase